MGRDRAGVGRATRAGAVLLLVVGCVGLAGTTPAGGAPPPPPREQADRAAASMEPIPPQYPFVCTTARNGLGQPTVDNQEAEGIPVAREEPDGSYPRDGRGYPTEEAEIIGWSRDCEVEPRIEYRYRTTDGAVRPLADPTAPLPDDIATVTTTDGVEAPYVIRWERGTINRFIYSLAMLAPITEDDPADPQHDLWNGRALYSFQGGVGIGRTQGNLSESAALYHEALSLGYAILYSTGNRTSTHYDLTVGGQTAVMVKDHFVATHGDPLYTVGVGGSGGGIQQYVYAQNHPGLLDGGVPQYSYPDMITQTIHVGDCELLEHYFERTDGDNPRWTDVEERQAVHGLNSERRPLGLDGGAIDQWNLIYGLLYPAIGATPPATEPGAPTPGLTECRRAWYGLTPLVLNPTFTDVDDIDKLAQGTEGVEWTHAADAAHVYGIGEDGFARNPWDNVGVQYGLEAVAAGRITPAEFLDLNAQVGSWKDSRDMVPEGCPFDQSLCTDVSQMDPWSSRQMQLSPDGGVTPAPRREGDLAAMHAAYEEGLVLRGAPDIPFIDWRHYLEEHLDMHNSAQSFATRQRMLDESGHHDNQVIWFTDARPAAQHDQTAMALEVLHEWITNIQANPSAGVGANRPAAAVDSCFATDGTLLHSGEHVWDGILDDGPAGPCTTALPTFSTSRRVAGAPITGTVFKCQTKSVAQAASDGDYGSWAPSAAEVARLEQVFPTGVCDYSKPDLGDPRTIPDPTPLERFVAAVYADVLGRAPTPDELADAVAALEGAPSRRGFASSLVHSTEVRERLVTAAYLRVLGRGVGTADRAYWAGRLAAGLTHVALLANLAGSPELHQRAGGTDEAYVERTYEVLLGRSPDTAGHAYWVDRLEGGMSRWRLATSVLGSEESRRARVTDAYRLLFDRSPDAAGLAHWAGRLRVIDDLDLAVAFLASPEYLARRT